MNLKERWQYRAIIKLFSDVNIYKEDFYIVPLEGRGYLTLQYINKDGTIESAMLHTSLMDLAKFLEEEWEFEWLIAGYRSMKFLEGELETLMEGMPEEVKKEMEKIHKRHLKGMKRILGRKM